MQQREVPELSKKAEKSPIQLINRTPITVHLLPFSLQVISKRQQQLQRYTNIQLDGEPLSRYQAHQTCYIEKAFRPVTPQNDDTRVLRFQKVENDLVQTVILGEVDLQIPKTRAKYHVVIAFFHYLNKELVEFRCSEVVVDIVFLAEQVDQAIEFDFIVVCFE